MQTISQLAHVQDMREVGRVERTGTSSEIRKSCTRRRTTSAPESSSFRPHEGSLQISTGWSKLGKFARNSPHVGSTNPRESGAKSTGVDPSWVEFGPEFANFRRFREMWALLWRKSTCTRRSCMGVVPERRSTIVAQTPKCEILADMPNSRSRNPECCQSLAEINHVCRNSLADIGPIWPELAPHLSHIGECGPTSCHFGRSRFNVA